MSTFSAADGTRLALHHRGAGRPLVCLPGGPMQSSSYLGDLGGLREHRSLALLDLRGTGEPATPTDPESYRCDRQVSDVEALRLHLGLDRIDLLGHSAGASLAVAYAAHHPERIDRLVLVTPSPRAVDLPVTDLDRREVAEQRRGEPWFPDAFAALESIWAGHGSEADWQAMTPFSYGRWDAAARAHVAAADAQGNDAAAAVFASDGAFDPAGTRAALATLTAPVLVVAGEHDVGMPPRVAARYAALFPRAELVVQPGAGHSPWLDDPTAFVGTVNGFLERAGVADDDTTAAL